MRDRMTTPPKPHELGLNDEIPKSGRIFDFTDMSWKRGQVGCGYWGYKDAFVKKREGKDGIPEVYALTADEAKRVKDANFTVHNCTSVDDPIIVGYVGIGNLGADWAEANLHKDDGVVTVVYKP